MLQSLSSHHRHLLHRAASSAGSRSITSMRSHTSQATVAAGNTAVQQLFEGARACAQKQKAWEAMNLTHDQVEVIRKLLGAVPLSELGFSESAVQDPTAALASTSGPRGRSPWNCFGATASRNKLPPGAVQYLHIYEDEFMSIGIFCFPQGASIPLHDHPGMTVFSRLLFGTLAVEAWDWVDPEVRRRSAVEGVRLGSRTQAVMKSRLLAQAPLPTPLVLFPEDGNLHEFVAQTPCAMLDVLVPPYKAHGSQDCTYFRPTEVVDRAALKPGSVVELEAIDQPEFFSVLHGTYRGIKPSTS